ncbi:hypothetical protein CBS147332_4960 [Penicillium roqueforti]|nr:hypothetical protein CBS147332_4960 [Penicillium roqueforti]KAI3104647.1 hypothetical protein CBS147331_7228 [Penicillium roqueforti]
MRDTLRPTNEYTPQAALLAVLTEIYYEAQDSRVSNWCLEDFMMEMDDQGYPLGDALDPFGLGFHPCEVDFSLQGWAQELAESTYFSRDYLKDLIPALRTSSIDNRAASLKELLLLNCCVSAEDLTLIVRFPRALERLTIRVPMSLKSQYEEDNYVFFSGRLSFQHSESLEYLDLDIYGGADHGLDLNPFDVLKEIIITPHSILGDPDEKMIMARSLQRLTIRYEEGTRLPLNSILEELEKKNLPNMRSVICQIPDNICEGTTSSEICVEAEAFKPNFKELGVELSTELVPYPLTMPKYDTCPCENLTLPSIPLPSPCQISPTKRTYYQYNRCGSQQPSSRWCDFLR